MVVGNWNLPFGEREREREPAKMTNGWVWAPGKVTRMRKPKKAKKSTAKKTARAKKKSARRPRKAGG